METSWTDMDFLRKGKQTKEDRKPGHIFKYKEIDSVGNRSVCLRRRLS